ncbi:MAG: excalibur calcium-binding domain-containing protein [Phycicoccus sp.]
MESAVQPVPDARQERPPARRDAETGERVARDPVRLVAPESRPAAVRPEPEAEESPGVVDLADLDYRNCTEMYEAGVARIPEGRGGYRDRHDDDQDTFACDEPPWSPVRTGGPVYRDAPSASPVEPFSPDRANELPEPSGSGDD